MAETPLPCLVATSYTLPVFVQREVFRLVFFILRFLISRYEVWRSVFLPGFATIPILVATVEIKLVVSGSDRNARRGARETLLTTN